MIKSIIFDFDGVILESADIKTEAFRELFADQCPGVIDKIIDYHKQNMGISRYVKFEHIYNEIIRLEYNSGVRDKLGDMFSQIVYEKICAAPFVHGALECLQEMQNYRLFIASGTPHEELLQIVQRRKIAEYFTGIHGAPRQKAEIVREILDSYKLEPREVVFVGDALTDWEAASATGVHFIARIAPQSDQLLESKYQINDLHSLLQICTQCEREE